MTEAARLWLGWRAVRRLVAVRAPRPAAAAADVRDVLVVLPTDETVLRAVWRLVDAIAARVVLVSAGDAVAFVPDAHAGAVVRTDALDWRGVPRPALRARLWTPGLDVAIDLSTPGSLVGAALVGGAPAGLRIGVAAPETAACYDLALGADTRDFAGALLDRLRQIRPPLVPLR